MIVKIKNSKNAWSYFECEVIHSKYEAIGKIESMGDWIVFLEKKDLPSDVVIKVLNLETEKSHLRTIITDRVCYVLNSEGKTIDKI